MHYQRPGEQEIVIGMSYVCEPIFHSPEAVTVECRCGMHINNICTVNGHIFVHLQNQHSFTADNVCAHTTYISTMVEFDIHILRILQFTSFTSFKNTMSRSPHKRDRVPRWAPCVLLRATARTCCETKRNAFDDVRLQKSTRNQRHIKTRWRGKR